MYAQIMESDATYEECMAIHELAPPALVAELRELPGFAGALNLVDRASGTALMIVIWETAEQARQARSRHGSGPHTGSIWQIAARV
jgi:hypothetical protein